MTHPVRPSPPPAAEILVVEDDQFIRTAIAETLRDEGYAVVTAGNGNEALEVLRVGQKPALILLDLMMPVMDGWEFRVKQKRIPEAASIPVLALSANDSAQARSFDADAYLRKPVNFATLLKTIRALLETAERGRDRYERFAQVQLDTIRIVSESDDIRQAGRAILDVLLARLDWDVGVLWLIDERKKVLRAAVVVNHVGKEETFVREIEHVELVSGEGLAGRVWEREDFLVGRKPSS